MLRIEITGTTVQELFESAAGVLGLLVTGGQTMAVRQAAAGQPMAAHQIGNAAAGEAVVGSSLAAPQGSVSDVTQGSCLEPDIGHHASMSVTEANRLVTDTPADAVRKRGRPKKSETITVREMVIHDDPVPDLVGDTATPAPAYTLDDHVRPKIRDLMKVRQAHLEATLPKEQHKNIMTQVTDWMLANLFAPFDIKKASDLPAVRFPEFMALAARLEAVA